MPYHLSIHILLYVQNNWFGLWTSLNCLGTVQIVLNRTKHFYNWILPSYIQTNWTCSKQFGPGQNRFGPVEGQGIRKKKFTSDMCLKNHLMLDHCPHNSHCFRTLPDLTRPALSSSTPLGSAIIVGTPEGLKWKH